MTELRIGQIWYGNISKTYYILNKFDNEFAHFSILNSKEFFNNVPIKFASQEKYWKFIKNKCCDKCNTNFWLLMVCESDI